MNATTTLRFATRPALRLSLGLLAALLLAVPCARAQLTAADIKFLHAAAQGGMTEVKLGEVAIKKGTTDAVKDFGRKMVTDHGAMNEELKALAAQQSVTLQDHVSVAGKEEDNKQSKSKPNEPVIAVPAC